MEKESLLELKKKIAKLSEQERKQRDLYLRGLSNGEIQGPMTGYASIDKPWLKYFSDVSAKALFEYDTQDITMYQSLYRYASNNLENIAIEYLGNRITYRELLFNIDKVADSLIASDVHEDDIVSLLLPNIPETRYLIYACSKIGAIANPIMPTIGENDLLEILKNTKFNLVFLMDGLFQKFGDKLIANGIPRENIIEISPLRSAVGFIKALDIIKNKFSKSKFDYYMELGVGKNAPIVTKKSTDIALIEQTGGTTGLTSKSVLITNGNVFASNYQLENSGLNFCEGDSLLDILLPSISYGAAFEHLTLCNGIKNYMIPTLVKEDISDKISKYKPNHILMGPIHFEHICRDKKKRNWMFLKNIVSGGDSMSLELESNSNCRLLKNNSTVPVEQGYGESECFGACACNHNLFVKNGSVGIPHLLTNIGIFDVNDISDDYTTDIELIRGKKGEICISSPVVMKGYLNNPEATNLVLKQHSDGVVWLHTGDIGYIDDSGYLFITDRIKDLIFRNGFKVSPQKINQIIIDNVGKYIETSVVIGIPDEFERNVPVFFYKLKDEYADINDSFKTDLCILYSTILSESEIPKDTVCLDIVPRTSAGKINKKVIKQNYIDNVMTKILKK